MTKTFFESDKTIISWLATTSNKNIRILDSSQHCPVYALIVRVDSPFATNHFFLPYTSIVYHVVCSLFSLLHVIKVKMSHIVSNYE